MQRPWEQKWGGVQGVRFPRFRGSGVLVFWGLGFVRVSALLVLGYISLLLFR